MGGNLNAKMFFADTTITLITINRVATLFDSQSHPNLKE